MNKRLSMDKGAWQAFFGPTRAGRDSKRGGLYPSTPRNQSSRRDFQSCLHGPFDAFCAMQCLSASLKPELDMSADLNSPESLALLTRIADALERLTPTGSPRPDLTAADAFVWQAAWCRLS